MPKLLKLLETVKLFLFEMHHEISAGNSDCCPKKNQNKKQTKNF